MHRGEIRKLQEEIDLQRVTLVPLSLYFKDGRAKIELGVAKGRTKGDKRQAIAERDSQREIDRAMGRRIKGRD
jgi:SsrA-binding protein